MNIVEHYKREVDQVLKQSILNLNASNQMGEQQSQTTLDASSTQHPLIQQVTSENNVQSQNKEVDYQNQQFLYFASQNKAKQRKCVVCKKVNPNYRCPKCKVEYCSQDHYKSHNLFCTQRFFKQQVEDQLKATKSSKQNIKKMVELLKQNQQQIAQDQKELMNEVKIQQISQSRLLQIQKMIDNNEQVKLRPQQIKRFQEYLKEIQLNAYQQQGTKLQSNPEQQTQKPFFQQYRPYWLVQEGLPYYLILGDICQVQEFNQSNNKELLLYRQKSSRILHQKLQCLRKSINLKKVSLFVSFDLLQVIYISALLMRSFNGQYLNSTSFLQIFEKIYDEGLSKMLSQVYSGTLKETCNIQTNVFSLIKARLINLQNQCSTEFKLIQTWLEVVSSDCQKIISNKFLTLQTLLRILQALSNVDNKNKSLNESAPNKDKFKSDKSRLKLQKKMQFLLCYTNDLVFAEQKNKLTKPDVRQMMLNQIKKQIAETKKQRQEVENFRNNNEREKMLKINSIIIPTNNK